MHLANAVLRGGGGGIERIGELRRAVAHLDRARLSGRKAGRGIVQRDKAVFDLAETGLDGIRAAEKRGRGAVGFGSDGGNGIGQARLVLGSVAQQIETLI